MNYWRMAMRIGSQGPSQWKDCLKRGIAAIGYYHEGKPVVEDCRKLTEQEYENIWRQKRPFSANPKVNLRNVAYRMKEGNTIYVKEGTPIVGKGKITKCYAYDPNILAGAQQPWEHYVTVDWQKDFVPFELQLGAEQITVLKLEGERLQKIQKLELQAIQTIKATEAEEGAQHRAEVTFRERNRALIEAKKANSNYRCEVCKMHFKEIYGKIGEKYIIAHHLNPIGDRDGPSKTTLDDIALVCPNCHAMLHRKKPLLSIKELRRDLRLSGGQ